MASSSSSSSTQVPPKLRHDSSTDEYNSWKVAMLRQLQSRNLVGFIDGNLPLPPETNSQAHKEWKRIDLLVKNWIVDALDDQLLPTVIARKNARDVWLQLETIFTQPPPPPITHQDIALDLIGMYPDLAKRKHASGRSALRTIALKNAAFASGARLDDSLWERFIYSYKFGRWHGVVGFLHNVLYQVIRRIAPQAKPIDDQNVKHEQALNLVKCLCEHMESLSETEAASIYVDAMLKAAELGIPEVIEAIVDKFPIAVYSAETGTKRFFLHMAVENRCEKVFNLIYQMSGHKHQFETMEDRSGNTLLHLVASLAPPHKLNLVSGAALQMQRELQWFKEVEKYVQPQFDKERRNYDGKTPKMIFTEEHSNLKAEGERWMKDTANSCSIAAALIATVVFAAAITVPGGNAESGYPLFARSSAFVIFAISDALSLFTSSTSLLMFLAILTSRYAEEDFLYALPKRLCVGLFTLFLSILSMMAAFSATIYLVFGRKSTWVLIPVAAFACLPVTSFVLLQFPLLVDVVSSTYGRGIFGKQSDRPFH